MQSTDLLIYFTNGFYNLQTHSWSFNNSYKTVAQPNTGFPYTPIPNLKDINEVKGVLTNIIPNVDSLNLVLRAISGSLKPNLHNNARYVFRGNGSNGKTVMLNFIRGVMGECLLDLPESFEDDDRNMDFYKHKLQTAKICIMGEPRDIRKSLLNIETIIKPIFIATNEGINSIEGCTIIEFPNRYVTNPSKVGEFMAMNLLDNLNSDRWKNAFFNILLKYLD